MTSEEKKAEDAHIEMLRNKRYNKMVREDKVILTAILDKPLGPDTSFEIVTMFMRDLADFGIDEEFDLMNMDWKRFNEVLIKNSFIKVEAV